MKLVRIKINDLIDQHGGTFTKCPGCSTCTEIKKLQKLLQENPEERFAHILQKGQDMTRSEIEFLIDNEVQNKVIRKHLGMTTNLYTQMLKNFGLSFEKNMKQKGVEEMAKITQEEYQDLKAKGMSNKAIAELKGVTPSYISFLIKQWKGNDSEKVTETTQQSVLEEDKPLEGECKQNSKQSEYEALVDELKAELVSRDGRIMELVGSLHAAQEHIDYLTACCEDLESEIEKARSKPSENVDYIMALQDRMTELEAELAPIRQLAYLKLKQDTGA